MYIFLKLAQHKKFSKQKLINKIKSNKNMQIF